MTTMLSVAAGMVGGSGIAFARFVPESRPWSIFAIAVAVFLATMAVAFSEEVER